jgi:hypothetical protein
MNAFGIIGQRHQIYRRQLKYKPENADKIVLTTHILRNTIRQQNIPNFQRKVEALVTESFASTRSI